MIHAVVTSRSGQTSAEAQAFYENPIKDDVLIAPALPQLWTRGSVDALTASSLPQLTDSRQQRLDGSQCLDLYLVASYVL